MPDTEEVIAFEDYNITRLYNDIIGEKPGAIYLYDGSLTIEQISFQGETADFTRRLWPTYLMINNKHLGNTLFYDALSGSLEADGNIEYLPVYPDENIKDFKLYSLEINGKSYKIIAEGVA